MIQLTEGFKHIFNGYNLITPLWQRIDEKSSGHVEYIFECVINMDMSNFPNADLI